MTTVSSATQSHFLIAQKSEEETREAWLTRYNTELCNENIVLRNCLKTSNNNKKSLLQAAQEIAELKEKQAAEMAAMKQEMERLKDEAARVRVSNIRLMREAESHESSSGMIKM